MGNSSSKKENPKGKSEPKRSESSSRLPANDPPKIKLTKREDEFLSKYLLAHFEVDGETLLRGNPPKWRDENKIFLFEDVIISKFSGGRDDAEAKNLVFDRYKVFPLPEEILHHSNMELEQTKEPFRYRKAEENAVEWHVNFADEALFGFYGGSLFAQDEHQVAEHPVLGSLRDALISDEALQQHAKTRENDPNGFNLPGFMKPASPVLISNVRRLAYIETVPDESRGIKRSIYGNTFRVASEEEIRNATTVLTQNVADEHGLDTHSNILAFEAPKGGRGSYDVGTIRYILQTAYTGFKACKLQAKEGQKVNVHTGNWGCGAFGGNGELMAILQILAARMANIDRLIYHTFDSTFGSKYQKGVETLDSLMPSDGKETSTQQFLETLESKEYQWGVGNGT